jgi:hypothetical protein
MHQSLQGASFHVEHIRPKSKGGASDPHNLCLACTQCNLVKSDRTTGIDPESGATVALFDPRDQEWDVHFRWDGYEVVPQSSIGRATLELLELNSEKRKLIRSAEEHYGLFPPIHPNSEMGDHAQD